MYITEWGWSACDVHLPPSSGIADVDYVVRTSPYNYLQYKAVKFAATWYLGPWSCVDMDISSQTDQLVLPMMNYTLSMAGAGAV